MVSALLTQNVRLAVSVQDEDSVMSANETEGRDVRIAISVRATSQSLGWIGAEAGIFQRLGLNITFPAMETAAVEAVAGLVRGEWDFVEVGGAPIVQGVLDGHDTVMLLAAEQAPLVGRYLVARQDFTAPMNLRGGRIGILTEAGQTGISAREMLRQWGITATLVPLGTYPKIYAALRAQDIDAGILSEEYRLAAQRGFGSTAFPIPTERVAPCTDIDAAADSSSPRPCRPRGAGVRRGDSPVQDQPCSRDTLTPSLPAAVRSRDHRGNLRVLRPAISTVANAFSRWPSADAERVCGHIPRGAYPATDGGD
jgi:hypothetical protein